MNIKHLVHQLKRDFFLVPVAYKKYLEDRQGPVVYKIEFLLYAKERLLPPAVEYAEIKTPESIRGPEFEIYPTIKEHDKIKKLIESLDLEIFICASPEWQKNTPFKGYEQFITELKLLDTQK